MQLVCAREAEGVSGNDDSEPADAVAEVCAAQGYTLPVLCTPRELMPI